MKYLILLLVTVGISSGFLIKFGDRYARPGDITHEKMTRDALFQVVAQIFETNSCSLCTVPAPGTLTTLKNPTVQAFWDLRYGVGAVSTAPHTAALRDIIDGIARTGASRSSSAKWNFNGEQILQGHQLLITLWDDLLHILDATTPDYSSARAKLAQYLHTLQKFYSNTNWIELKGNVVYEDLGKKNVTFENVAPPDLNTCNSCDVDLTDENSFSCESVDRVSKLLTSGYRSGQDVRKPTAGLDVTNGIGKCSHGGLFDESRKVPATGGINKETNTPELSPHWYLHEAAAKIAEQHTLLVLNGIDGLLSKIGVDKMKALLNIVDPLPTTTPPAPTTSPYSLGFVIDTTGSMSEDIKGVETAIATTLNKVKGSFNKPTNYVLSMFNDPASKTTVRTTTDPNQLLSWVRAITVGGGGDCPEYAMSGLEAALTHMIANENSQVFLFTDADAKDASRKAEVIKIAQTKKIKVNPILTGKCSKRRRRAAFQ